MSPEEQKQTTDWLIAIGTIALPIITVVLSVLTVFQDKIRTWLLKPKISVSIQGHTKTPTRVQSSLSSDKEQNLITAYSFRILVHNLGNQRAEEVEVYASSLLQKLANGTYSEIKSFPGGNLKWVASNEPFTKAISPGMQRQCRVFKIANPAERSKGFYMDNPELAIPADKTILAFELTSLPFARTHLIGPGTYRLVLHIAAANINPKKVTIEISHTGQWLDDEAKMFSQGVGMQIV